MLTRRAVNFFLLILTTHVYGYMVYMCTHTMYTHTQKERERERAREMLTRRAVILFCSLLLHISIGIWYVCAHTQCTHTHTHTHTHMQRERERARERERERERERC
jgi:NADH:ubiquinone oxidoreductase subunit 4 (subunit M)